MAIVFVDLPLQNGDFCHVKLPEGSTSLAQLLAHLNGLEEEIPPRPLHQLQRRRIGGRGRLAARLTRCKTYKKLWKITILNGYINELNGHF